MHSERTEYPETRATRRRAWMLGVAALLVPAAISLEPTTAWAAPFAFTFFVALTILCIVSLVTDRLHRRIDAIGDHN
jgi:archaellum biogenesis protein FlaJ (TadC family)